MTLDRAPTADQGERISFLLDAIHASAALGAADRLGVLVRLESGQADAVTLARECGISVRGARSLLTALAALGVVQSAGDGSYGATLPLLSPLGKLPDWYARLDEVIRGNRPAAAVNTPTGAEMFCPDLVSGLAAWMAPAAACAADHLAVRAGGRVLDVGAGAAPWSLALAAQDSELHVTAVDLPPVLERTRAAVATAGRQRQFRYLAGDMSTVDWGSAEYDLAIAGNVCHLFGDDMNRQLVGRLIDALRPGGMLAIIDALPNERLDGPRSVALYGLSLLLRTQNGGVYPFSTYAAWLREAGFEAIERVNLADVPPVSLVTAWRPGT